MTTNITCVLIVITALAWAGAISTGFAPSSPLRLLAFALTGAAVAFPVTTWWIRRRDHD